jgi:phage/plasmid-like protein (TIGR03299 family)
MTTTSDTTIIGMGGSPYATESLDGPIPFHRVRDLFDFTVGHAPVFTMQHGVPTEVPGRHALVRTDTEAVLNVTSKRYGIHQFSDVLIDNLLTLTDSSDGDLEVLGAGLLKRGAVGWAQVKAPTMRIAGDDLAPIITLASSHDGSLATSYRTGMFRFACSNQVPALRSTRGNVYKLKHTQNSHMRFEDARHVLGLMWNVADDFAAEVAALIDTAVTDRQFTEIVERLNPRPVGESVAPAAVTRWENNADALRTMWTEDERVAPYRGTAWGAVQAFSTHRLWERLTRTTVETGPMTRAGRQMQDLLNGRLASSERQYVAAVRDVVAA